MKQGLYQEHWSDHKKRPAGGVTTGRGFTISWQNGPLGRGKDRIEPNARQGLKRRLTIKARNPSNKKPATLWFRAIAGKSIQRLKPFSYRNSNGLTASVSENAGRLGTVRKVNGESTWFIPITIDGRATIEVNYQW